MAYSIDQAFKSFYSRTYRTLKTRDEVIAYFEKQYPGQTTLKDGKIRYEWKTKIVDALQEIVPSAKRDSLTRRFQKDKKTGKNRYETGKVTAKQREEYEKLGKKLSRKPARVRVTGIIHIRFSQTCERCTIHTYNNVVLEGATLDFFVANPDTGVIIELYAHDDYAPCNESQNSLAFEELGESKEKEKEEE